MTEVNKPSGILAITMAGRGERFLKAGYEKNKFEISVNNKTLLEWSLTSLLLFNKAGWMFSFVIIKNSAVNDFIKIICSKLEIINYEIIEIPSTTDGQATTALTVASKYESIPFAIYNIDTYVSNNFLNPEVISSKVDGFIPCFQSFSEHFSFVKINKNGLAINVAEKERISCNASLGFYYFRSAKLFKFYYYKYFQKINFHKKEKYVAPIYNSLIKDGLKVEIQDIPETSVHIIGTPDELENFKKIYGKSDD